MPNVDDPPDPSEVRDELIFADHPFLQKVVESKPKTHEVEHMKRIYSYEEFRFVAHFAFENPARRSWFLIQHFSRARWKAGIHLGAHIVVGIIMMLFIFS